MAAGGVSVDGPPGDAVVAGEVVGSVATYPYWWCRVH